MGWSVCALIFNTLVSFLPLVVLLVIWIRYPAERLGSLLLAVAGGVTYLLMQWGVKEHGLSYLFNHTALSEFCDAHYIPYLLSVAFAGALLAFLPQPYVFLHCCKRRISFRKSVSWGLAYGMIESFYLIGYKSLRTLFSLAIDGEQELSATAGELFLSGYERILLMFIETVLIMVFVYFCEQHMSVKGACLQIIGHTAILFFPGFFIAFSTSRYYEVFDRNTTLLFVYLLLTCMAVCAAAVGRMLSGMFHDASVDTPEETADFEMQLTVRRDVRRERKNARKKKHS